jgi:pimeloyl-ACP methyl ester carboxylesterase
VPGWLKILVLTLPALVLTGCTGTPEVRRYDPGELRQPLLIPVFDRPESIPTIYTHALDSDTMALTSGPLARVDLQLLAMVDHAGSILSSAGISTEDDILLFGFSVSGTFANRFAALHPRRVHAVASG